MLPHEELKVLNLQVEDATDLESLRPIFERMMVIAQEHPDDFEVVLGVDQIRQHIVAKGAVLRERMESAPAALQPSGVWNSPPVEEPLPSSESTYEYSTAPPSEVTRTLPVIAQVVPPLAPPPPAAQPPTSPKGEPKRRGLMIAGLALLALLALIAVLVPFGRNRKPAAEPKRTPQTAPVNSPALAPAPETQALRLLSDLDAGQVLLDGQPAGDLQDGQFLLDHLAPGPHSVRVVAKNGEAAFAFESAAGQAPQITGSVTAKNVLAVVVGSKGGQATVHTSASSPMKISLNGQAQGKAGPQGLELKDVPAGEQTLSVGEGPDEHKLVISFGPAAAISAFLKKSDMNTGTLVVSTGEDDVSVFLNGKEYRRKTRRGTLRIQTLGSVLVHVAKPGFQPEPDQKVAIKKGEETKLAFHLTPMPKVALLQIHDAPPGTAIALDDQPLGRVGADGSFGAANLAPGEHSIEVQRDGFVTRRIQRTLKAGETLVVNGSDIVLAAATGSIHLVISPADATVSYRRTDESQLHTARDTTLKLEPGSYLVVVRAPGFVEHTSQASVVAGETRTVEVTLNREKAEPVKPKAAAVNWAGWTREGDEYMRKGGNRVVLYSGPLPGTIAFTAHLRKGGGVFRAGKLRWFVEAGGGVSQFEVDKKRFQAKGPAGSRAKEYAGERGDEDEHTYAVEIDISPERIVHRMKAGDKWVTVDSQPAKGIADGKFGFVIPGGDEIGIADLRILPK